MGQKCKIIGGIPIDNKGNKSKLYAGLEQVTKSEKVALDYWVLSQELGMGETSPNEVIERVNEIRNSNKSLKPKDIHTILESGQGNLSEVYSKLKEALYVKGIWKPSLKALKATGLYTDFEAKRLFSSSFAMSQVKALYDKLHGHYFRDDFPKVEAYGNKSDIFNKSGQFNDLGKKIPMDIAEVNEMLLPLIGVKNREEFDSAISSIGNESLSETYNNDKDFADKLFKRYSELKKLRTYKVSREGLQRDLEKDYGDLLSETAMSTVFNDKVPTITRFLLNVPNDIWDTVFSDVQQMVRQLEKELIDYNIDIIGLSERMPEIDVRDLKESLSNIAAFVESLDNSVVSDEAVADFGERLAEFMGNPIKDGYTVVKDKNDYTIINISNPLSDYKMFSEHRLIRTEEGHYHKVADQELESMYETMFLMQQNGDKAIPDAAIYPANSKSSQESIIQALKRYVAQGLKDIDTMGEEVDVVELEKMVIYRMIFGHPNIHTEQLPSLEEFSEVVSGKVGVGYLLGDFIGDFQNYILGEKYKDSLLYNEVLSKFKIASEGITYHGDISAAKSLLPMDSDMIKSLRLLTFVQKRSNFRDIFDSNYEGTVFEKEYISIFPEYLELYTSDFDYIGDNIHAVSDSDFIRTNNGVFEKVGEESGIGIYSPLDSQGAVTTVSKTTFEKPKITKRLNKAEKAKIDEQIDGCY